MTLIPETPRLSVSSSFQVLEAIGAIAVTVRWLDPNENELPVLVGASIAGIETTFRAGANLQEALGHLVKSLSHDRLTLHHAATRAKVRLPEGGIGTLIFLDRSHVMASVRTEEGRTRNLPASLLTLLPIDNEGNEG